MENILEKYSPLVREYWLPLALGCIGLIFLGYGMIGYFAGHQAESRVLKDKPDILFEAASEASGFVDASGGEKTVKQAVVDVEGAVEKPGVYNLQADSRVQDALIAAGGLSKDADRDLVARGINLASKVIDGGKIYIPFMGEEAQGGNGSSVVLGSDTNSPIDVNHASESELNSLPGVGPVTSQKIISNRPYTSVDELVQKKIVGNKVFEDIKDLIVVQ